MNLSHRHLQPERMDDPELDAAAHRRALHGLRRINVWSRTSWYLSQAIRKVVQDRALSSVRILDIACGDGDNLRRLARYHAASDPPTAWVGCDISSTAIAEAQHATRDAGLKNCQFLVHDIFSGELPERYDIVLCTLFLHHLREDQAIDLLRIMASKTKHALLVDDLVRSRMGYLFAKFGCRLLSRSPIVHFDGPASVRAAYTIAEVEQLATSAGLLSVKIRKHWPERFTLEWRTNQ